MLSYFLQQSDFFSGQGVPLPHLMPLASWKGFHAGFAALAAAAIAIHAFVPAVLHAGGIATGCAQSGGPPFAGQAFPCPQIHAFSLQALHASLVAGSLMLRACFAVSAIDAFFRNVFTSIIAGLWFPPTTGTFDLQTLAWRPDGRGIGCSRHDTIRCCRSLVSAIHCAQVVESINAVAQESIAHWTACRRRISSHRDIRFRLAAIVAHTGAMTAAVYGNQRRWLSRPVNSA